MWVLEKQWLFRCGGAFFGGIYNGFGTLTIFAVKLYHRCFHRCFEASVVHEEVFVNSVNVYELIDVFTSTSSRFVELHLNNRHKHCSCDYNIDFEQIFYQLEIINPIGFLVASMTSCSSLEKCGGSIWCNVTHYENLKLQNFQHSEEQNPGKRSTLRR